MKTREQAYKNIRQAHFLLVCPYCKTELVVPHSELKSEPYKPHKITYTYWQGGFGDEHKHTDERIVSSDTTKDIYKGIKCCNCGHVWDENKLHVLENCRCNADGLQTQVIELSEAETKKTEAFIQKHINRCCPDKPFTVLGMQFTYTITPGGLGSLISIKCNACGETENISCTEDW